MLLLTSSSLALVSCTVKLFAIINDINDCVLLQKGLAALYAWSDLWQLPLSLQKFYILVGIHNYSVNNVSLPEVTVVADLGQ